MKRGGTIIHQTVLNANARGSADNRSYDGDTSLRIFRKAL